MSSGSLLADARLALEAYLAGRAKAERVVVAVGEAYYREAADGRRVVLRPVIEVIERAAPGIVALGRTDGGAGFEIKLAERPFPKGYEPALRDAAAQALGAEWDGAESRRLTVDRENPVPAPGEVGRPRFLARVVAVVRRLFSASA